MFKTSFVCLMGFGGPKFVLRFRNNTANWRVHSPGKIPLVFAMKNILISIFWLKSSIQIHYIKYTYYTSSPAWQCLFSNLIIQVIHLIPIQRLLSSTTSAAPRQWVHLDFHSFESHSAHLRPANNQHPWPSRITVTTT